MSIEWDKVLPSVIGALTGGTMSLLGSYFSARRQAKKDEKRRKYEERREGKIALNSVKNEIKFNHNHYKHYKIILEKTKHDTLDLSKFSKKLNVKMDKWEKHSDTIENIEELSCLERLQNLYRNIYNDVNFNLIAVKEVNEILEEASQLIEEMEKIIQCYE